MTIEASAATRCRICGCGRLDVDEVECDGMLLLTECPRCHDRRTARPPAPGPGRPRVAASAPLRAGGGLRRARPAAVNAA